MANITLILQACAGLFLFIFLAWVFSENRRAVNFKSVFMGLGLQIFLALIITKFSLIRSALFAVGKGVMLLKEAALAGTSFVFGYVGGGPLPFPLKDGGNTFIFAFQVMPLVMVVSALSMLLFHWGILPFIVRICSKFFQKILNIGGALGVCAAAKMFLSHTEGPLLVRPYLSEFSRSELFSVMTTGMATTTISIMVVYAMILEHTVADPIAHILTASIISVPAALTISRILIPQTGEPTSGNLVVPYKFAGPMEAIAQGTADGIKIYINIIGLVLVFLSLVALANSLLAFLPSWGGKPITLQLVLGYSLAPLTWLLGIPWAEAIPAGELLGAKTILNELIAFIDLAALPKDTFSTRSALIMIYALAGFANLSCIGIQIGCLGTIAPTRKQEIMSLGLKSLIAGTIASCMSAAIMGILYSFG